jgi:hypothetical protein
MELCTDFNEPLDFEGQTDRDLDEALPSIAEIGNYATGVGGKVRLLKQIPAAAAISTIADQLSAIRRPTDDKFNFNDAQSIGVFCA